MFDRAKHIGRLILQNFRGDEQRRIFREYQRGIREDNSAFPTRIVFPKKFGRRMPERVVELVLARLTYKSGVNVLDIGYANAMKCHLDMIRDLPEPRCLIGVDIAHPTFDTTSFYERTVMADISESSLSSESVDVIWCISTLEHFGMDNSGYTDNFKQSTDLASEALVEMTRLLRPGGSLLVTVPFGKYEDHGWFQNYDHVRWSALLENVRSNGIIYEFFFHHTHEIGWMQAPPEQLATTGYYSQNNSGAACLAAAIFVKSGNIPE